MLIPCDLERASPRDPFRLRAEDDDPVVNPTLRHQLSVLGVDLPALGSDSSEDESIDAYVAAVGDLVGSRGDWSVDAAIALGAFSYSKLAMYQDLERMLRQGVRSDLTQLLAAGGAAHSERATASDAASATPRSEDLAGGRLDDLLDIRDQYAVLPADFSQLGALDQARQGGHLVIHGPPGTGKSQTITSRNYNHVRPHQALELWAPDDRRPRSPPRSEGQVVGRPILGGLHHEYERLAA